MANNDALLKELQFLNKRLDGLEQGQDNLEKGLKQLEGKIGETEKNLSEKIETVERKVAAVHTYQQTAHSELMERVFVSNEANGQEQQRLEQRLEHLEKDVERLEQRLSRLDPPPRTETVFRSLTHSDFTAAHIMRSNSPVTAYLRWKEQDLLALSPLVRLLWETLIDKLLTIYDDHQGRECRPVLLLIDEAGRTAIPMLADQATTVVGRGIYLWVAIQSLSQLEVVYGRARAQVLRDNMESQVYYRPLDLATAQYLEVKLGKQSAYAHSTTEREGVEESVGLSEQPIPLLTAQDIMQLKDEEIICFHRRLPPIQIRRIDWRHHSQLAQRRGLPVPELSPLPQIADLPQEIAQTFRFPQGYIDPDRRN